jgi:hypothetical protein
MLQGGDSWADGKEFKAEYRVFEEPPQSLKEPLREFLSASLGVQDFQGSEELKKSALG